MSATELQSVSSLNLYGVDTSMEDLYVSGEEDLLDRDTFLQLLVTELEYQDPLNPMENQEFLSQLADLSTVEELQNANTNLETLQLYESSINNAQSVSMIGKVIKANGDTFTYSGDGNVDLTFELGAAAATVTVTVYDADGTAIASITENDMESGSGSVSWDGTNYDSSPMDEGEYSYAVTATDSDGNSVATKTYIKGLVTGVSFENGIPMLHIGSQSVTMGDILEVATE